MATNGGGHSFKWAFILTVILAFGVAGAFVYYYLQYLQATNTLVTRDAEIASLQGQVATLNAKVAALQNDLTTANASVAPLTSQISSMQTAINNANTYIDEVNGKVTNLTAQVAALKSQNADLQSITSLSRSTAEATSITVHQTAGVVSSIVSFNVEYAGYIVISATSSAPSGFIQVTDDNPNFPFSANKYLTASSNTFSVPVLPGTVGVFFGNTEKENEYNVTMTVTYYY